MAVNKDLTGQRFGKLTVREMTKERKDGYRVWLCSCDCGRNLCVNTRQLMSGVVQDCGCVRKMTARRGPAAEDLTGRVFGRLTVLRRAENVHGRTAWFCRCECGREKTVTAKDLKAGKVKSCGCLARESSRRITDLTGRRFGRLVAQYPTSRRDRRGSVYWHCICDCGNEAEVSENNLVHGNSRSCGCLKNENQKKIPTTLHHVDGTCVEILEKRKYRRDNKSGFRGVYRLPNGKYRVDIGFKGKRFYVGCYRDFDRAVEERLSAERLIYGGFLKAYYRWAEKAKENPDWAEDNPLVFRVYKQNGRLDVIEDKV